ncbi:stress response translation initiation inhibitor YciH [Pseudoalteromonas tunicata]|uniref:stress response translation initiation inhibitor YciH n=1 Tax=Pseudoalteromonas tunicata TaxID=314281 RepID=UPI00273EC551|nr:stress response translation initiation inhibitor YciH [Pseudoalteromonas tunicata]MDP5212968.1 stress response translation initiation inhibitor YciH [Pseudoalteromonas tunicata]
MSDSHLVYSTDSGRITPVQEKKTSPVKLYSDGFIRIERQTKGRKGKGVMLIVGINPEEHDLKSISKSLKTKMGQGGALKDNIIEIQGDDREKLKGLLEQIGFKIKLAGG